MKNIFYREFLWIIVSIILSLLFAFLFLEIMHLSSIRRDLKDVEKIFSVQFYLIGCITSFFCIYIVRLIVSIVKAIYIANY